MKCTQCGYQEDENFKYCPKCGGTQDTSAAHPHPTGMTAGTGKTQIGENQNHKVEKKEKAVKNTDKKPAVKKKSVQTVQRTYEEATIRDEAAYLDHLFELRSLNPILAQKIVAVAFLYQTEMAPTMLIGRSGNPTPLDPKIDPYQFHFYILSKILPGYQPHIIPAHLQLDYGTLITARKLEAGEPLDVNYLNPLLATMLAKLLYDNKLLHGITTAISLSGNSIATGEARIAIGASSRR